MTLPLDVPRLRRALGGAIALLVAAGLAATIWDDWVRGRDPYFLTESFGLSYEGNVPTWFASMQLMLCALALGAIGAAASRRGLPYVRHWYALAGVFAYISCDELVQIHEIANSWFDLGGVLYFGWVIPGGVAVAAVGVAYLRFLGHLPRRTRRQFVLAGCLFVGGALGVELLLGAWTAAHGEANLGYGLIDLCEESLELAGAAVFLCALAEYLESPEAWPEPLGAG